MYMFINLGKIGFHSSCFSAQLIKILCFSLKRMRQKDHEEHCTQTKGGKKKPSISSQVTTLELCKGIEKKKETNNYT